MILQLIIKNDLQQLVFKDLCRCMHSQHYAKELLGSWEFSLILSVGDVDCSIKIFDFFLK